MKRLHVQVGAVDLGQSMGLCSTRPAAQPTAAKDGHANKWMLDHSRVCCTPSMGTTRAASEASKEAFHG